MRKIKILFLISFSFFLEGCAVAGGFMDSLIFKGDVEFFQSAGKDIDEKIYKSEDAEFAKNRALERSCKFGKEELDKCRKIKKPN